MEIILVLLLVVLNGFFALSEISLLTSQKSRLETLKSKGVRGAGPALKLLDSPEQFLSAVQVGITLIGVVSGAYGGLAIADQVAPYIEKIPLFEPYAYRIALTVTVAIVTYLSIVIGELLPKTIAVNSPERIAVMVAPVIQVFTRITYPIVWFLSISTSFFQRILFIKSVVNPSMTEEELKTMIRMARTQGVLEARESEYHENLFRLSDRCADQIMTHRSKIASLSESATNEQIEALIHETGYSKFPVFGLHLDQVAGMLYISDFYLKKGLPGFTLKSILREPVYLQESMGGLQILEEFRKTRNYIGVVLDEYGTFAGLITIHDLMENIVGDLPEADDLPDEEVVKREDGSWLIDGSFQIDELERIIPDLSLNPEEFDFRTLAGLVIEHLGHLPKPGERIHFRGFSFEVMDLDGKRVDKVLISRDKKPLIDPED